MLFYISGFSTTGGGARLYDDQGGPEWVMGAIAASSGSCCSRATSNRI
jgi:hypothetical protein